MGGCDCPPHRALCVSLQDRHTRIPCWPSSRGPQDSRHASQTVGVRCRSAPWPALSAATTGRMRRHGDRVSAEAPPAVEEASPAAVAGEREEGTPVPSSSLRVTDASATISPTLARATARRRTDFERQDCCGESRRPHLRVVVGAVPLIWLGGAPACSVGDVDREESLGHSHDASDRLVVELRDWV